MIFISYSRYVNFEKKKPGDNRFDQPACNACGNCVSGCNTGAKNTLNMNYLPDAKVHGAKIFTEVRNELTFSILLKFKNPSQQDITYCIL